MRNTRTLSVTLPPDMLKRAQSMAKRESRTMSELIREALRHYERRSWWDDINAYGRSKAGRQGIREQDVDRLVHELRANQKPPSSLGLNSRGGCSHTRKGNVKPKVPRLRSG
jgi:predicted transcriptional regulator